MSDVTSSPIASLYSVKILEYFEKYSFSLLDKISLETFSGSTAPSCHRANRIFCSRYVRYLRQKQHYAQRQFASFTTIKLTHWYTFDFWSRIDEDKLLELWEMDHLPLLEPFVVIAPWPNRQAPSKLLWSLPRRTLVATLISIGNIRSICYSAVKNRLLNQHLPSDRESFLCPSSKTYSFLWWSKVDKYQQQEQWANQ